MAVKSLYRVDHNKMPHQTICNISATSGLIFTVLHGMQTRSSDENAICPSGKRVICEKIEERSVQIFIPYERAFSLVF